MTLTVQWTPDGEDSQACYLLLLALRVCIIILLWLWWPWIRTYVQDRQSNGDIMTYILWRRVRSLPDLEACKSTASFVIDHLSWPHERDDHFQGGLVLLCQEAKSCREGLRRVCWRAAERGSLGLRIKCRGAVIAYPKCALLKSYLLNQRFHLFSGLAIATVTSSDQNIILKLLLLYSCEVGNRPWLCAMYYKHGQTSNLLM